MPNGIPVWVTTIVQPVAIIIVFGVIVYLLLWFCLARLVNTVARNATMMYGQQLEQRKQALFDMEALHAEARAVITSVTAFEMDASLPLKLRQQAVGLRVAQLLYGYEQMVAALRQAYNELAHARKKYASHDTSGYQRDYTWAPMIKLLEPQIVKLEQDVANMEPLLERYGVAYEKLARPMRAI